VVLEPVADAYSNEAATADNNGTSASLAARGSMGVRSFLQFALPPAPAGKRIASATLKIRTSTVAGAGSVDASTIRLGAADWQETSLNWSNQMYLYDSPLGTLPAGTNRDQAYTVPLSVPILADMSGATITVGVVGGGADILWFWSREHAASSYRPQLVLTYS